MVLQKTLQDFDGWHIALRCFVGQLANNEFKFRNASPPPILRDYDFFP